MNWLAFITKLHAWKHSPRVFGLPDLLYQRDC